jgi:PST family polysaccharide transporter
LSLSACLQIVGCSSGAFFQSLNATKNLFLCGIINAFILISFILAGVFYLKTIEGVALSFSVSSVIGFFSTFYFLIKKSFGENLRPFLKVFVSPFIFSVFLFVFLYFINLYINSFNLFTTTFIKVSVGAIAFYIYLRYIEKLNMRELYKTGFKN